MFKDSFIQFLDQASCSRYTPSRLHVEFLLLSGLTLLVHHSSLSLIQSYAQHTVSPLLFSAHLSLQAYIQPLQHSGDVSCSTTPPSCQQGHHPVAVCRWPVPPGSFPRLHADCTGT